MYLEYLCELQSLVWCKFNTSENCGLKCFTSEEAPSEQQHSDLALRREKKSRLENPL